MPPRKNGAARFKPRLPRASFAFMKTLLLALVATSLGAIGVLLAPLEFVFVTILVPSFFASSSGGVSHSRARPSGSLLFVCSSGLGLT